jgi:pantetheine-phosphate adenylyltransferase
MTIALYPGTFDPLTYGHLDLIERAARLADKLVIGVAENAGKNPLFSLAERSDMLLEQIHKLRQENNIYQSIEVKSFTGLLTDFARETGAGLLVRGLRAVADFEYETQMAHANKRLNPALETIFLTAAEQQHFVASSLVKEIARFGGDISSFVPDEVAKRLYQAIKK